MKQVLKVETYVDAASSHGGDCGAEAQIGDLEVLFRQAFSLLSPAQKREFALMLPVKDVLEGALVDLTEEHEALSADEEAEDNSPLGMVDRVCELNGGNGIYSVGAIAALQAMRYHWADHLAEGQPASIILDDLKGLHEQLTFMGTVLTNELS